MALYLPHHGGGTRYAGLRDASAFQSVTQQEE
jgi:hypothetical protein